MNEARKTRISKTLSRILRHAPESVGLTLDAQGWVEVRILLAALARHGMPCAPEELAVVVRDNNKQRFAFSEDGLRIRANQGHSVTGVDLQLAAQQPPEFLYHGTAYSHLDAIRREGLKPGSRHHVHLSLQKETAIQVGGRHGRPVVLVVRSGDLHRAGQVFHCSENGVWLTGPVPVDYLAFPD